MEKVAAELGYSVTVTQLPGERNGDCAPELRRIRVSDRLAPAHQVKTLAHELAHAILHEQFEERGLAELEAESVAYIVSHELDLDSSAYSFGYLATWGRGGDQATRRSRPPASASPRPRGRSSTAWKTADGHSGLQTARHCRTMNITWSASNGPLRPSTGFSFVVLGVPAFFGLASGAGSPAIRREGRRAAGAPVRTPATQPAFIGR